MSNFKNYENPSIFHRWAAAQWRRPKDPTIYGSTEIDMAPALAFLDRVREEWGVQVTVTHLVAKALAMAIARHPETNAKVRFWGKLEQRKTVDITVLIAGAGGRDLSAHRITAADQLIVTYVTLFNDRVSWGTNDLSVFGAQDSGGSDRELDWQHGQQRQRGHRGHHGPTRFPLLSLRLYQILRKDR